MTYEITAYRVSSTKGWSLEPADPRRDWMEQTPDKGAHRCLPLVMANQCGWIIRCPLRFKVEWNGKATQDALSFKFFDEGLGGDLPIKSSFGLGIVSFLIPWLFRTSEGIGLMVRGPTNQGKENIVRTRVVGGVLENENNALFEEFGFQFCPIASAHSHGPKSSK